MRKRTKTYRMGSGRVISQTRIVFYGGGNEMFSCFIHGWSSHHSMCPICASSGALTSGGTTINIEEIERKECEHDAHNTVSQMINGKTTCWKCGAEIKPTGWEVVE